MKAIVVDRHGGPEVLRVADVDVPAPGPGEVAVRHGAIGVNYVDTYWRSGLYPKQPPFVLGREAAGTVEAVGPGVTGVKAGQRVAYADDAKPGAYAEVGVIAADRVVPVPDGIDDAVACVAMVQGMTAHYLSRSTVPLKAGMTAVVHAAAGGVGQLLVQMAKELGATVIATCSTSKIDLVKSLGADHVIDYTTQDFATETKRIAPGGVDVVYDSVGKDTFDASLTVLMPRGTIVLFGTSSGPIGPLDAQKLSSAGSLFFTRPTLVHYTRTTEELRERAGDVFAAIRAGKLHVATPTTYALTDAAQAHIDLQGRKTTGKLVLVP